MSPSSEGARTGARPSVTAVLAVLTALLPLLTPGSAAAQEGCVLGARGRNMVRVETLPSGDRITYIGGPHFVCDRGVQIFADSAVAYSPRGMSHLMGDVLYLEEGRELRAQEARYFSNEGRLQAQGDVEVLDEVQGSRIQDGDLVYLLQTQFRQVAEMTVTREADGTRPTAVLTPPPPTDSVDAETPGATTGLDVPVDTAALDVPGDTTALDVPPDSIGIDAPGDSIGLDTPSDSIAADVPGAPAAGSGDRAPYTVRADRLFLLGNGYFTASGDVEIVRDSLFAYADSAEYDQAGGALVLEGQARVEGTTYELTGRRIDMTEPGGARSTVRARREARLTGDDVLLTSAQILVVLDDGALDRLVATPLVRSGPRQGARPTPRPTQEPGEAPDSVDLERPKALVQDFVLTADSLEMTAPDERVQRVFAAGRARSVSAARDSLNADVLPEVARDDWLEGDTVIIRFPGAPQVPPLQGVPSVDTLALATADSASGRRPEATPEPPSAEVADSAATEPEEIIARGRARSLYRLPPSDSTFRAGADAPAVHYVVGQEIRIFLDAGEVDQMRVSGQTRGVHLEPLRRARPDSSQVADSSAVAADTAVAGPLPGDTASVPDGAPMPPDTGTVGDAPPDAPVASRPGPTRPWNDSHEAEGRAHPPKDPPWIRR